MTVIRHEPRCDFLTVVLSRTADESVMFWLFFYPEVFDRSRSEEGLLAGV